MVLEAQTSAPTAIIFPESSQERLFKVYFADMYYEKNHLDCYNLY